MMRFCFLLPKSTTSKYRNGNCQCSAQVAATRRQLIVNSWAQKYFTTQLYEHQEGKAAGLRYFAERGFREDTIRKFQLGYSLDQRDALYKAATKSGYKKEFLEKTGLRIAYDNGG